MSKTETELEASLHQTLLSLLPALCGERTYGDKQVKLILRDSMFASKGITGPSFLLLRVRIPLDSINQEGANLSCHARRVSKSQWPREHLPLAIFGEACSLAWDESTLLVAFQLDGAEQLVTGLEKRHVSLPKSVAAVPTVYYKRFECGLLLQEWRELVKRPRASLDDVVQACQKEASAFKALQHALSGRSRDLGLRFASCSPSEKKEAATHWMRVEDLNSMLPRLFAATRAENVPDPTVSSDVWAKRDMDTTTRADIPMDKGVLAPAELLVCWKGSTVAAFFLTRFHMTQRSLWIYLGFATEETQSNTNLCEWMLSYLASTAKDIFRAQSVCVLKPVDASGPAASVDAAHRFCTRRLYTEIFPAWTSGSPSARFMAFEKKL